MVKGKRETAVSQQNLFAKNFTHLGKAGRIPALFRHERETFMITLEKLETLRQRTNAGFAEAKAALEAANGDLAEAQTILEREGKTDAGGFDSSSEKTSPGAKQQKEERSQEGPEDPHGKGSRENFHGEKPPRGQRRNAAGPLDGGFPFFLRRVLRIVLHLLWVGNRNRFEIWKNGSLLLSLPATVCVLLAVPFFGAAVPCLILGLFGGCSYRFYGPDFGQVP